MLRYAVVAIWMMLASLCASAEWYAGGYIGAAHTQNSSLFVNQPGLGTSVVFHDVAYEGNSFQSPLYYGVRGGDFFTRHFGIEAEFIHLKVFAKTDHTVLTNGTVAGIATNGPVLMNKVVQRFSISHGNNLLLANAVVRQDFLRTPDRKLGRLILNARLGFGATIPHPESTILGAADEHYQVGRWAMQLAAGGEFRVWRSIYWVAEYKFTRNKQRVDVVSGTAESLLMSHHGVTGIVVHF